MGKTKTGFERMSQGDGRMKEADESVVPVNQ